MKLPEVEARQKLQNRTWKLEVLIVAQWCICRSKQFADPTRSRRAIQENSKSPTFGDFFHLKSVRLTKSLFPIKVNIGVDSPEDTRRRSIPVALPSSSPIKRYDRKTIPIHETSDENKWHCYDALLNFASFDLKFEPRIWTTCANKRKACSIACSIVQTSYGRFGVFSDPCVDHISPPMNKSKWGRRSVCWCMINTVRVKKSIQNTSKLSGTLPSKGCVSTLAGPARSVCTFTCTYTHTLDTSDCSSYACTFAFRVTPRQVLLYSSNTTDVAKI